jgi:hypothetical protein
MPARLYPKDGPRSKVSHGECAVYRALAAGGLPEGWTAWHSLRLRVGNGWEGEGDFVFANPKRGLLVLEVKGGRIELVGGRWLQNGHEMDQPPRTQAMEFAKHLGKAMIGRGMLVPGYGAACAFPDVDFDCGPGGGDVANLVIGHRDLSYLSDILPGLLDRAVPVDYLLPPGDWIGCLTGLWGETWVPSISLRSRADDAAERLLGLDSDQLSVLDFAGENARAVVVGGAGSGKTVVARELAVRRARQGQRALYACFTDALAREVDSALATDRAAAGKVQAVSIRRYARDLLVAKGQPCNCDEKDFWSEVSLRAACEALPAPDERPDLLVVDEAQDFASGDWELVQALSDGRGLWVMLDENQRFWDERKLPAGLVEGMARLNLKGQHRNPPAIEKFAALYAGGSAGDVAPCDPAVLRVVAVPAKKVLDRVRHEIETLQKGGARPGDIAVLSLAGQTRSRLLEKPRLGTIHLSRADAPDASEHVVADTFLRFKGLERPFVIVTDLVHGEGVKYDVRMHIALTRATAGAIVVCDEEDLGRDPRLAGGGRG